MSTAKDFVSTLKEAGPKTSAYDTTATVIRIEGQTAWVHIPGGVNETPASLTIDAKPGDIVQVRVSGGRAFLVGNSTAPPTDDTKANKAKTAADEAKNTASKAKETADGAKDSADSAIHLAEGVNEHFWHDNAGAHITEDTQEDYQADPASAGGNTLITSQGMAIRKGQTELAVFSANGAQVGKSGAAHSVIDADGQRFYARNGTTQLANIGYGNAIIDDGSIAVIPYFTFGNRAANSVIGGLSFAEGSYNESSGYCSHAEGFETEASGHYSHAEGNSTHAQGENSHAEGGIAYAVGDHSHSEGYRTEASAEASHAQNYNTIAGYPHQTVIGRYNDNQSDTAFEIGNGSNGSPHNAFVVDWDGNVSIQGSLTINGSVMDDYVIDEGQASNWLYRKWKSGKIEAWLQDTTITISSTTAVGNVYRCSWSHAIASGVGFSAAPQVFLTVGTNAQYVFGVNGRATSATAISGYAFRANASSSTSTVTINIYAVGY